MDSAAGMNDLRVRLNQKGDPNTMRFGFGNIRLRPKENSRANNFHVEFAVQKVQNCHKKTMSNRNMTVAEFFTGIGLLCLGLGKAGWRTDFANAIDEDKWQMYKEHFGDGGEFVVGDIHKLY
jgi:hypothetical protein